MQNVRPFYVLCPRCPKLYGPMHGSQVHVFRCKCETGKEPTFAEHTFDGDPVIVGYEPHRDGLVLLQKLTADRMRTLNPYAGDAFEYDGNNLPTMASIERVMMPSPSDVDEEEAA
jgi:hypothetical protein